MTTTTNLDITHWTSGQNQPEVTVNEALNILDAASGGVVDVSITSDADYTLPLTGTKPLAWQTFYHKVTSTVSLGATRQYIVPSEARMYLIYNNTTGGQSLDVKTSGGSAVTITNGTRALLYCDGTNIFTLVASVT